MFFEGSVPGQVFDWPLCHARQVLDIAIRLTLERCGSGSLGDATLWIEGRRRFRRGRDSSTANA